MDPRDKPEDDTAGVVHTHQSSFTVIALGWIPDMRDRAFRDDK